MVEVVSAGAVKGVTLKFALPDRAGIVTLPGATLAAAVLLLISDTNAPPAGAGLSSVAVPVELLTPPCTLIGLRLMETKFATAAAAVMVNIACLLTLLYVPVMVEVVSAGTVKVVTVKFALADPAGIVT